MNIRKENFDKLNQLDRIEFRQRHDLITGNNMKTYTLITDMIMLTIICFGILGSMAIQLALHNELESSQYIMGVAYLTYFFGFFTVLLIMIISFVKYIIKKYKLKKLEEEYFTEEIKIKK